MMPWTRIQEVKKKLNKKWDKGAFLAMALAPETFAPLRIPLKHPTARELSHHFDAARSWVSQITRHTGKGNKDPFDIEWQKINHRTLGKNKLPKAIVFKSLDQLLGFLGKFREAKTYTDLFDCITARFPGLAGLLTDQPMEVLAHEKVWEQLLSILACIKASPCPGIYLRQLEIPGVDTKFIETHRAWLTKLLLALLPDDMVDKTAKGATAFEQKFGFRAKPVRIRFRTLDPALTIMGLSDLEIPAQDFNRLPIAPETVFIIENNINGLAFPHFPKALVIFGLGYGLSALKEAAWLKDLPVWYWGDIDTHGFAMLDQIRHYFPQTRSFLMDEATFLSHKTLWGRELKPATRDLALLTPEEAVVYEALRQNRYAPNLRLEQERISYALVRRMVDRIRKGKD